MSKRILSEAAQVAKFCRQHLKAIGIKGRATSENYAGGDAANIRVFNQSPAIIAKLKAEFDKYQMGHFDGMADMYEISNSRDDVPQVKFLFINNEMDAEIKQAAWLYIRERWNGADDYSASYEDVPTHAQVFGEFVSTQIHRLLGGAVMDSSDEFWALREAASDPQPEPVASVDDQGAVTTTSSDQAVTVRPGTKPGYTEILFSSKPENDVLADLKSNGFRWSRMNSCWYGLTSNISRLQVGLAS